MTRRTKRLLMATVMCLAVLANVVVAAAQGYGLKVRGAEVTDTNKGDILGDGGSVSYNPDAQTLTLNGAKLRRPNFSYPPIIEIPENMDLIIALKGENTITTHTTEGIHAGKNLTISGDSKSSLSINVWTSDRDNGITAGGTVTIKGADPEEEGPTVTVAVETTLAPALYGISANGLTVTDGSKLSASVSNDDGGGEDGSAILVNGDMSVKEGAEVTTTSTNGTWGYTNYYDSLEVNGKLTVDNATVKAKAAAESSSGIVIGANKTIEILGNSVVEASGTAAAISGTATLTVYPKNGAVAEVKVGSKPDGTDATLFGSYSTTTTFSGASWTQLAANKYISASITGGNAETPPGGGTEGTPEGGTETTPEGGTGVPLPEEEIPVIIPPKTGDNTPILFYLGALLLSGTGIVLITVYTHKRREGR